MSKDHLIKFGAIRTADIEIDGQPYKVREPDALVSNEMWKLYEKEGSASANAYLAINCLFDLDNKRVFSDDDLDYVKKEIRPSLMTTIVNEVSKISEKDAAKN